MNKSDVSACSVSNPNEESTTGLSVTGCGHDGHSGKVCEDKVRERAYLKWEAAGSPSGDGVQFWLEAEEEVAKEEEEEVAKEEEKTAI